MPNIIVRKEEKKRRARFQLAEEFLNFIMIPVGIIVAVLAAMMIFSLVTWAWDRFFVELKPVLDMLSDAIIIPT